MLVDISGGKSREIFKHYYLTRRRYRASRRSIEDLVKLARISVELTRAYLEAVEWKEWKRVLMLKT